MSKAGRTNAGGRASGTHFKGPLLVAGGPFDDAPLGIVDHARSPYKVWYEDFAEQAADGQIETMGFTVTAINTPTAATETILGANAALFINPGSKADSGSELQFNIPSTAASLGSTFKIWPETVSTATLMDGRELFFQVRMGSVSDSATDNDSKYLLGIFVNDTTLLNSGTGVPSVSAGGFGFHKGEAGAVTLLCTNSAITAAGTAGSPAITELALTAANTPEWHTYAARLRCIDASAGTGQCDFWYDNVHVGTIANDTPFVGTDTYSFTFAGLNGPAQIADWHIDYILTGVTRPGLTYPYTDGTIY